MSNFTNWICHHIVNSSVNEPAKELEIAYNYNFKERKRKEW